MNLHRRKKLLSCLLIGGGFFLFFLGARILVESYFGQTAAAREFRSAAVPTASLRPILPRRGDTMAKLTIPRLDTELYVVEGDNARELRRGPGHLAGSAMPGKRGNCVIAGHRDTHFRALKDIRTGDDIVLATSDGEFHYKVNRTSVVSPADTRALQPTRGPVLNLITCYPFYYAGSAPKRFVVEASLATQLPVKAGKK